MEGCWFRGWKNTLSGCHWLHESQPISNHQVGISTPCRVVWTPFPSPVHRSCRGTEMIYDPRMGPYPPPGAAEPCRCPEVGKLSPRAPPPPIGREQARVTPGPIWDWGSESAGGLKNIFLFFWNHVTLWWADYHGSPRKYSPSSRGGNFPGLHRFRPRFVGVAYIWKGLKFGGVALSSPSAAERCLYPEGMFIFIYLLCLYNIRSQSCGCHLLNGTPTEPCFEIFLRGFLVSVAKASK